MPNIEDAIQLALHTHRGQTDKGDHAYILHPLRVLSSVSEDTAQLAAVLHDVVEDGEVTLNDLRKAGYPGQVVKAVDALTKRQGETYEAFIKRLKPNRLARTVKLADLKDNMNLSRIPNPSKSDLARLKRYRAAWTALTDPSESQLRKLAAFATRSLVTSKRRSDTFEPSLDRCASCESAVLRPVIVYYTGSKPRDFVGIVLGRCGACDRTSPLLSVMAGARAVSGIMIPGRPERTEEPTCQCGAKSFYLLKVTHYDNGFFDDAVLAAECSVCANRQALVFTD